MKTAGAAIYANRHYLELFRKTRPERLARDKDGEERPKILQNVFIHHGAKIHPEAVVRSRKSNTVLPGCCVKYLLVTNLACNFSL